MADLVKQAVQKEVTSQLNEMQELLKAALTRITSLEEIVEYKATPRAPRLPSIPSSSSSVCRHWLHMEGPASFPSLPCLAGSGDSPDSIEVVYR